MSVTLAFSAFWLMEADISSTEADDSSTLAACSDDDCDRDWAVADTWPEALVSASAAVRTWVMVSESLPTVLFTASFRALKSPW